ncbi:MAG: isochorismatase family protein, partial [Elusimicrobia bacterium]|nr:isochorismatase family protein [Elusimicrobiota bacterium]
MHSISGGVGTGMRIIKQKHYPGLAALYLASLDREGSHLVEFVDTLEPGIPKSEKWVMMVSTQVGCPVGCRMCDTGALEYQGNLTSEEILDQVRYVLKENPGLDIRRHPKLKIHLARMGEPSLNPHVLEALKCLGREFPYPGVMPCLSTVAPKSPAVEPFFEELLRIKNKFFTGGRFQLQFSLHSTDEMKRRQIVPIRKWSLEEVAQYGMRFVGPGDRKVTLNFALAKDQEIDTSVLGRLFSREKFLIKITPVNPTLVADRNKATHVWMEAPGVAKAYAERLGSMGFQVILSPSLPEEIAAATSCGQLWSESLKEKVERLAQNQLREMDSYVTSENILEKPKIWKKELLHSRRSPLSLDIQKIGLLVMDMQNFFLDPYSPAYLPPAKAILPNVRNLVEIFREMGRPVFFTLHAHEDPERDGGLMVLRWKKICRMGSKEARISPILNPQQGSIFRKCRYNAFSNTSLERSLRQKGIEGILVVGVMTNLCVESTVRDAFDREFRTFVVADATAAHTEELHLASLK